MVKKTFEVTDMSCVVCASNVERTVQALKGVGIAKVNFAANELTVHFDPRIINIQQIKAAVEAAGYGLVTDVYKRQTRWTPSPTSRRTTTT